jgi:F-type H+-transporting ATPase subunit gamma
MPNLHDIERRINSVNSTKQITRTMEMVAAAKIRRATERLNASDPYSLSMSEMLANVASRAAGLDNPLLEEREGVKNVLYIAVVSDRGLAGGFNSNVLRHVEHAIKAKGAEGVDSHVIACGKKAISYFSFRKIPLEMVFKDMSADPTVEEAAAIAAKAIEGYIAGEYDQVVLVYNHTKNAAEQVLREEVVLPVDTSFVSVPAATDEDNVSESASKEELVSADTIFEPDTEAVLNGLLPAYVKTMIYHGLVDSAAGEQGARRNAMKSATDNANEMVETLTRYYNRVRQGAITTELNEIVAGAAALEE